LETNRKGKGLDGRHSLRKKTEDKTVGTQRVRQTQKLFNAQEKKRDER